MRSYEADSTGVLRDDRGRAVGRAGAASVVQVVGVHATYWPADGGPPLVMKAVRPEGHVEGCLCVVCGQLDTEEELMQQVVTESDNSEMEMEGDEMSAEKKLAKAAREHDQNMERLAKQVQAAIPTLEDPVLGAQAGKAVTYWRLYQRAAKGTPVPRNGGPRTAPGTLPSAAEQQLVEAARLVEESQSRATGAGLGSTSARTQLESVRDQSYTSRVPDGQVVPPQMERYGDNLPALEKAVAEAPTADARSRAGEALTLARLRVLNGMLMANGRLGMR